MATLYTQQDSNTRKTWFLMFSMFILIIAIGWFVSFYYNNPFILFIFVVYSIVLNISSYWFSDKIVIALSRARPVTKEALPDVWNITENLAITAGLPMPKLYVIDDPAPNAFATGRNKDHSAIAVTTGLVNSLDRSEIEGVIAHEMAHIGNKDILLSTVVVVLVGLTTLVADFFIRSMMFGNRRRENSNEGGGGIIMIIGIVLLILSPIIAMIIQLAISRKREFLADASGALLTRYPEGLASALEKISSYGSPLKTATNANAHMYISNPFGSQSKSGLHKLFMTHPPTEDRIKALRGMDVGV